MQPKNDEVRKKYHTYAHIKYIASDRSTKNKENQFHLLSTFSTLFFSMFSLTASFLLSSLLFFLLYDLFLPLFQGYKLMTRTIPFHIPYEDGEGSYYNNKLMVKWWKWQISKCIYDGNVWVIPVLFPSWSDGTRWQNVIQTIEKLILWQTNLEDGRRNADEQRRQEADTKKITNLFEMRF